MDNLKVLFVDDEPGIVRACYRVLRNTGVEVLTTVSAFEAVRLAETHEFAVVVSDQRMPEMEGVQLLEKIRELQPDSIRIILTGYADITAAVDAINRGAVYRFLNKPWDDEQLRSTIRLAVEQYQLLHENRRLLALTARQNEELRQLNESLEHRVVERTREVTELSERQEATLKGSLKILTQLMEVNSSTIGHHSRRVADLAVQIGEQMQLSRDEIRQLEVAALLHDVGKLMLPGHLVRKDRSRLTREERTILQQHAIRGEAIIHAIPFLDDAASYVRHHHEQVNGSGYPDQLRGQAIPLGARIIAVADAWDKQLNDRSTFHTQSAPEVLSWIRSHVNEAFDSSVVRALEAVFREGDVDDTVVEDIIEVNLADLRPGMILATDIRSDAGALLLPADAKLTAEGIRRLRHIENVSLMNGVPVRRVADAMISV